MLKHATVLGLLLGLSLFNSAHASAIHRCTDLHGHTTFTQQPCPDDQQQTTHHLEFNSPLQSLPAKPSGKKQPTQRLRVVGLAGGAESSACANALSPQERRTAVVRKQIRAGMNQADIESALGKPQRVSQNNGNTTFHYRDLDGNTRTVRFKDGCVKP